MKWRMSDFQFLAGLMALFGFAFAYMASIKYPTMLALTYLFFITGISEIAWFAYDELMKGK